LIVSILKIHSYNSIAKARFNLTRFLNHKPTTGFMIPRELHIYSRTPHTPASACRRIKEMLAEAMINQMIS